MVANSVCGKTFNIYSLEIPFMPLRTIQLLRISELANSPKVRYEIFFLSYIDYFQKVVSLTVKIYLRIKVEQLDTVLFAIPTINDDLFLTGFFLSVKFTH